MPLQNTPLPHSSLEKICRELALHLPMGISDEIQTARINEARKELRVHGLCLNDERIKSRMTALLTQQFLRRTGTENSSAVPVAENYIRSMRILGLEPTAEIQPCLELIQLEKSPVSPLSQCWKTAAEVFLSPGEIAEIVKSRTAAPPAGIPIAER